MRNMLFFHHIHAHAWKLLLKYEWFSNLHLHFWFYYWAPASNFKFLSGYLHIDNTLTSQLIHLPLIPTKPTSSHLSSWLMASLSHSLAAQDHNFYPYLSSHYTFLYHATKENPGTLLLQYSKYPLYPHCASSVSHFFPWPIILAFSMVSMTWILLAPN